ncbi:allantoinase AllB [Maledivibacter halophilus]|uniref:allantoinase n=1 Tax=Maledivibacter halophilus TaxID=36842 RepID=A0A1T5MWZ8_9FIRM|nr:allantoinase AllB [Maledivibacter halophilus]SKC92594.1 allantoinase [Maledivibacter halophilus]
MLDLLIKNACIVDIDRVYEGNIAIDDGKIIAITSQKVEYEAKRVIDAKGKKVFPGGVDCHAHLNDPGFEWREDFKHGSKSAAAGGITTIIDMPLQNQPALTNKEIFKDKAEALSKSSVVDYAFWGGLVDNNLEDLKGLYEAGVVGLKAFLGPVSPDYSTVNLGIVREAMETVLPLNLLIGFHCEDYCIIKNAEAKAIREGRLRPIDFLKSRPVVAELIAVNNVIDLARETGARVHICHVSHPIVAEEIKKAQSEGIKITAETCSHYLVFSEDDVIEKGMIYKCAPPLRKDEDREKLWQYVKDGTISCVASDHSPCAPEEKSEKLHNVFEAWGGISGIQSTFEVMFNEVVHKRKLSPKLLAKVLAYGPAKTFGLYPQKGVLSVGSDADIVIVDPEKNWEITSESLFYKNKISAFIGLQGKGKVEKTIVRGEIVFSAGKIIGDYGYGNLIKNNGE